MWKKGIAECREPLEEIDYIENDLPLIVGRLSAECNEWFEDKLAGVT